MLMDLDMFASEVYSTSSHRHALDTCCLSSSIHPPAKTGGVKKGFGLSEMRIYQG